MRLICTTSNYRVIRLASSWHYVLYMVALAKKAGSPAGVPLLVPNCAEMISEHMFRIQVERLPLAIA
jgi:hypothetical protein